jgi:hypothetical protein
MSKQGTKAATEFGRDLPRYPNQQEAERDLFARRNRLLASLVDAASKTREFKPDFSPESLKDLESWYFDLVGKTAFSETGLERHSFEEAISMYLGEILVRNRPPFEWFVQEFAFTPGAYEIGVRRPLYSLMLSKHRDLTARPNNKRRQSLWNEYRQHAA